MEHFYSNIDSPFLTNYEIKSFIERLGFYGEVLNSLDITIFKKIFKKPRRFSETFLKEEKIKHHYSRKIARQYQKSKVKALNN